MYACSLLDEYVKVDAGEGVESPGDGISGGSKMSQVVAENQIGPEVQKLGFFNHWAISPAPRDQQEKSEKQSLGISLPLPALETGENLSLRQPRWVGLQSQWTENSQQPQRASRRISQTVCGRVQRISMLICNAKTKTLSRLMGLLTYSTGGWCLQLPIYERDYDRKLRNPIQQCPVPIGRSLCKLSFPSFHLACESTQPCLSLFFGFYRSIYPYRCWRQKQKTRLGMCLVVRHLPQMCKFLDSIVKTVNTNRERGGGVIPVKDTITCVFSEV